MSVARRPTEAEFQCPQFLVSVHSGLVVSTWKTSTLSVKFYFKKGKKAY